MSTILSGREHTGGELFLETDVVVVGSGAGGAVVAAEMAEAGHGVVVLEEGPRVTAEEHGRMRPSESMRHVWRDGAMSIAIGRGDTPMINVTMGRCVGGSSFITGGVCFRVPERITDRWSRDLGLTELTSDGLLPYYDEVERAIGVETVPEAMRSRGTELFGRGLEAAHGHRLKPLRRNTRGCRGCGQCNFGCPHQAKRSVDLTYLPRATAAGAEVIADCLVDRVVMDGRRAVGVAGALIDNPGGRARRRISVRAQRVVLAAGAWHDPLILWRSRLGRASSQIGRNLTLHPAFRLLGRFDEPVRGWSGSLQSAFSDAFEKEGLTLVSLFVPVGVLAATMPGFGPSYTARTAELGQIAMFGGLIHDAGGGRVFRGPGREPVVTYRMAAKDRAVFPRAIRLMAKTFFAAGAKECYLPILGHEPVTPDGLSGLSLEKIHGRHLESASQHPLGSCRMGTSPDHSVVDTDGRVWGTEELYIADGAIVPTSLGVNPQLTIMAMALRIARGMLERL